MQQKVAQRDIELMFDIEPCSHVFGAIHEVSIDMTRMASWRGDQRIKAMPFMALLISGMAGCGVQAGETSSDDAVELSPGAAIGSESGSGGLRPLSSEPVPQPAPNSPLAPGLTVLHTLTPAGGIAVRGALTEFDGRLYGLAGEAGPNASPNCYSSANWHTLEHTAHCPGSLFSLALDGSGFRVEHAFGRLDEHGQNVDGYHPYGTLAVGHDRRLYGVAQAGGVATGGAPGDPPAGFGVLYAYDPAHAADDPAQGFATLHSFGAESRAADGEYPMGAVAVTPDGSVCGTAKGGGHAGTGTVWCWRTSGQFDHADLPGETYGGVALAGGLLHGTTWGPGMGVYFTADPETMAVRIVDSFPSFVWPEHGNDNTPIQAPLALRLGGVVVAREFGGTAGAGLIARLTSAGIRTLREAQAIPLAAAPRFANATGGMPNGQLAEGPDGAIYGTMQYGGAAGTGAVYRLSRGSARIELLWSWSDSAYPYGGVTLGSDCALYGVTFDTGQVWRMTLSGCR
jgi:hypothetical protein